MRDLSLLADSTRRLLGRLLERTDHREHVVLLDHLVHHGHHRGEVGLIIPHYHLYRPAVDAPIGIDPVDLKLHAFHFRIGRSRPTAGEAARIADLDGLTRGRPGRRRGRRTGGRRRARSGHGAAGGTRSRRCGRGCGFSCIAAANGRQGDNQQQHEQPSQQKTLFHLTSLSLLTTLFATFVSPTALKAWFSPGPCPDTLPARDHPTSRHPSARKPLLIPFAERPPDAPRKGRSPRSAPPSAS